MDMNHMVEDIKTMLRNRVEFLHKRKIKAQEADKETYQAMASEVQYMLIEVERIEQGELPMSS